MRSQSPPSAHLSMGFAQKTDRFQGPRMARPTMGRARSQDAGRYQYDGRPSMKKVVFLGGLSTDDNSTRTPYAEQFSEDLKNYEISSLFFDDLLFHFAPGKFSIKTRAGTELKDFDLVIFRGKLRQQ